MAKIKKDKTPLSIFLTVLPYREIKKTISEGEKIYHIDVTKIIMENFSENEELNDVRFWIINQMIIKKIEGFRTSKVQKIFITVTDPCKSSVKSFKELMKDNKISPVQIEIYSL